MLGVDLEYDIKEVQELVDDHMESGWHTKEGTIEDTINLELMEIKDTIKEIPTKKLPSLTTMVKT